jgi:hypothetical protein
MKKIIFIGITLFTSCFVCTNLFAQNKMLDKSTATFGRYGDCTTGRGICGIDADNLNAKSIISKFSIEKENDSTLVLKIFNNRIVATDEVSLFGKASTDFAKSEQMNFQMDVDLPLNNYTKLSLQLDKCSKILSGLYPVIKFDSYYLVELKLK